MGYLPASGLQRHGKGRSDDLRYGPLMSAKPSAARVRRVSMTTACPIAC